MGFIDISSKDFTPEQIKSINFACSAGLMRGYVDGSFRPNKQIDEYAVTHTLALMLVDPKNKSTINESTKYDKESTDFKKKIISVQNVADIFNRYLFRLIPKSTKCNFVKNDKIATRADLADIIYKYCSAFLAQFTEKELSVEEQKSLIKSWTTASFNPFRLIHKLYWLLHLPEFFDDQPNEDFISILPYFWNSDHTTALESFNQICAMRDKFNEFNRSIPYRTGYHYTSLKSLYNMLTKSNSATVSEPPKITLHMSNSIFLNDPMEGKLFDSQVNMETSFLDSVYQNNTYIMSLSLDQTEDLSMWVQYADFGKGCRIEFDIPPTLKFQKVFYDDNNSDNNNLVEAFRYYFEQVMDPASPEFLYLKDQYDKHRFCLKDNAYNKEQEIRYVRSLLPQQALEYPVRDDEFFPRLYCKTPDPFYIKSVMLGPACPNREHIALYLKRKNIPEITISKIHFR